MASHDYYSSYDPRHQDTSYHGRADAPLPPVSSSPSFRPTKPPINTGNTSPVVSPFEDHAYPVYPQPSLPNVSQHADDPESPHYYGRPGDAGSTYSHNDPFTDGNAIPMQSQSRYDASKAGGVGVATSPTEAEQGFGPLRDKGSRRPSGRSRGKKKKNGLFTGKITWAVFVLTLVQVIVFIYEIVHNATLTGSPIEIHPNFNPMIGPSPYILINVGARYVPCMRQINVTLGTEVLTVASPKVSLQCPNTTSADANCHLADLCGFGLSLSQHSDGVQPQPNQWWRFIVPIFLHGGIIHIGFNMLLQWTLGRDIERQIGTLRFLLVYFSAGIFGFVMGGNFAPNGLPSTGCSGSLFGIIAIVLLDLLYTWKKRPKPVRDLCFILLDIIISFVLGLLPALDNFSHIGGFLMGLVLGISILHSPDSLRERIGLDDPPYATVAHARRDVGDSDYHSDREPLKRVQTSGLQDFAKQPVGFFKGRKPLWWTWWLLRVGALVGALLAFILLLRNFYIFEKKCQWCKYLSCLPIKNWCDIGNLSFTDQTTTKLKRSLEIIMDALAI